MLTTANPATWLAEAHQLRCAVPALRLLHATACRAAGGSLCRSPASSAGAPAPVWASLTSPAARVRVLAVPAGHEGSGNGVPVDPAPLPGEPTPGELLLRAQQANLATSTMVLGTLFSMLGVEPGVRASAVGVAVATAGAPAPVGLGQPASAPQGTHGRPQPEFELGGGSGAGAGSGSNGGGGWGKGDGPGSDGFGFGSNGGEQSRGGFAGWIFALAAALACLGPFAAWQLRASRPLPASAPLREALPLAPFMLGSAGATGATIRARRLQARTSVGGAGAPSNRLAMWVPWLPLYPAPGADPDGRSLERVESALSRMLREQGPWRQTDPYGFWHGGEGWGAPLRSSGPRHGSPGGSGAGSPRASTAGLGGGGKGAEAAAGMRLPLASATAARGAEGPRSRGRALHESVGGGVEVVGFHDEIDAMGRVRDGLHRAHGVAQVWLGSRRGAKGEEGARREAATLAV